MQINGHAPTPAEGVYPVSTSAFASVRGAPCALPVPRVPDPPKSAQLHPQPHTAAHIRATPLAQCFVVCVWEQCSVYRSPRIKRLRKGDVGEIGDVVAVINGKRGPICVHNYGRIDVLHCPCLWFRLCQSKVILKASDKPAHIISW